jgi:hypothetical protein
MAADASALVSEHSPDFAILSFAASPFTYEFVVNRVRRRLPWLYRPAQVFSQKLKVIAGGVADEVPDTPRALVYRIPEAIALRLIGGETSIPSSTR